MRLTEQLLRQIDSPALSPSERASLRCQIAKELTDLGDHEGAYEVMSPLWAGIGERPRLENLERAVAADVLLRAGILYGLLGSIRQVEGAQETAKDLISEGKRSFEDLKDTEKVIEAQIALAVCYWREAAFDEARVLLREVLDRCPDKYIYQRARAYLNSTLVEVSTMHFKDALALLTAASPLFDQIDNQILKGNFHFQLALVLRKLGTLEQSEDYTDRAIVEYTAASYHYERGGNKRYRASVENNLGFLLFTIGKFTEAHKHLDRAQRLFISLKDSGNIANVNETRARLFLSQGRNGEAERAARAAVHTLEKGDEPQLLAESLTTHGVALARLERILEARATLERALEVAEQVGDVESAGVAAITIIEELGENLAVDEMLVFYERADRLLADSKNRELLGRLRACARLALSAETPSSMNAEEARGFVYKDERMAKLVRTANHLAAGHWPVLITGETGTGKESLARLIHGLSQRTGQFVAINCLEITEHLIESRLFGHLRASFKSAAQDSAGAVREAACGTLFLEEIAELSLASQGKLMRLVERGEIHALGASLPECVDVRIIAATTCDLKEQVARKKFREDLFHRLNAFHLEIPPLRERPADISALATYFVEEFEGLYKKRVAFTPESIEALVRLPLRGNTLELRSLIERTFLKAREGALITETAVETLAVRQADTANLFDPWEGSSIKEEVLSLESRLIRRALEGGRGSVTEAARLLGITHQRLCAMLQARHKNLLPARKATRPRKRSILKKLSR